MGRYSKVEENLVFKCAYDLEITDIQLVLQDHGFIRSIKSITKKIEDKKEIDKIQRKKKARLRANKDIVKHRAKTLLNGARTRAKNKRIPFNLDLAWIENKLREGKCEATGLTFLFTQYEESRPKTNPYAPSLDRIDSSRGYTPDNVQLTLLAFNKFKSDMTQHTMIEIAKAIVKYHMSKRQFTVNN